MAEIIDFNKALDDRDMPIRDDDPALLAMVSASGDNKEHAKWVMRGLWVEGYVIVALDDIEMNECECGCGCEP